ncbi:hypothetical protein [Cellulomonas alba]|uniref:Uncharacterized protein n=1 Tax=Cellulomonas alba TaxID=3053467 RepID=A0ABT7SEP8_9CELL|nr:hypothetical protein [Cellulomonas alba]MDM7854668.1 hypothetical protein [Cellulomonas alba]
MSALTNRGLIMRLVDAYDAFNEKVTLFFLRFVGPPSVERTARPVVVTAEDRARDAELRGGFERVVGPDGRPYLVERD